ncbi:unnamed protein product [Aspergillus oryzae]|uniref:Unnamed protein product n=2 Tax=Aspergillus oryzae TaxID=5062 RepID=A0AAN5BTX4_ASPOZ|nr:unnamed protein product [Aspergillus oryzae]GMF96380.1 unnamed protein product [Aspergillus oryzae]GMG14732.1 unnamed protein product [Aspergillus oryzae]GMG26320.1 unnamed protein product [Aspergillus oryzae]GMG48375.1 unnamed protein product [Aspergillus oryzae var. brunneus]
MSLEKHRQMAPRRMGYTFPTSTVAPLSRFAGPCTEDSISAIFTPQGPRLIVMILYPLVRSNALRTVGIKASSETDINRAIESKSIMQS